VAHFLLRGFIIKPRSYYSATNKRLSPHYFNKKIKHPRASAPFT